jgi:hypothetical protein
MKILDSFILKSTSLTSTFRVCSWCFHFARPELLIRLHITRAARTEQFLSNRARQNPFRFSPAHVAQAISCVS